MVVGVDIVFCLPSIFMQDIIFSMGLREHIK